MAKGLWKIPDVENLRTPVSILKEQASALTEATGGVLIGEIQSGMLSGENLDYSLNIVVPSLNGYTYSLLNVSQPMKLYPLTIYVPSERNVFKISNEEELNKTIEKVLSSDETSRILASLLAQARSTG